MTIGKRTSELLQLMDGTLLGFVFSRWLRSPALQVPVRKFSYSSGDNIFRPVISPDGRRIAYFAGETEPRLWIQDMDREQPRELKGATGIDWFAGLFWSPAVIRSGLPLPRTAE